MKLQKNTFHFFLLTLFTLIVLSACDSKPINTDTNQTGTWKTTEQGIEYATLSVNLDETAKDLIVVKIDPTRFSFSVYQNTNQKTAKTIEQIHNENNAEITVNGSFFTETFQPTGLLIANGQELSNISGANLVNGIIAINYEGHINFFDTENFSDETRINAKKYEFAIQNGPIILDENGNIKTNKENSLKASRTAMGIDKDDNIVLIIIKQSLFNIDNSLTLDELAHITKENPELQKLNLHSLINLDGGSSTGLMIDNKYYPEMEKVQNVVLIKPRPNAT